MVSLNNPKELIQPIAFAGFMGSAIALLISTTFFNDAKVASLATLSGTVSLYAYTKKEKADNETRLQSDLESASNTVVTLERELNQCKDSESSLVAKISPYMMADGTLLNVEAQNTVITSLRADLDRLQGLKTERDSMSLKVESLNQQVNTLQATNRQWDSDIDRVNTENEALERENNQFKAKFESVDELAKLRADAECSRLHTEIEKLTKHRDKLTGEVIDLASECDRRKIYIEEFEENSRKNFAALSQEFKSLNEAATVGIPETIKEVLNERDRELMRVSGVANQLLQPLLFHSIGEFERANRLIQALYEGKPSITLDRGQIVPYDDKTGFDVYLQLRNGQAVGDAFIEPLNELGNDLAVKCCCIKDLNFEVDRVNPHRIKTAMIFRKASKKEPKSAIDKHWTPASQFEKIYKLLKKPVTRVMGSTGEGKGIFVNLLLALEANQTVPTFTRLHDPVDGSSQDYWQISKISKGKSETTKAVKSFISEFNDRLESGISEPKTLDVFDEIDILADSDSSVNKAFLNSSKGMRHCGMRAYLIGQSPSVGKKGFEWADMDNFNAVYFGSAIITAIDKTPSLSNQSEALRKAFDKLKSFCDLQNEEGEFEEGNLYRVGLLVTSGKATFFELPSADSIVCDWSKLTQECEAKQEAVAASSVSKTPNPECPVCGEKMRSASSNWLCQNRSHTKEMGKKTYLKSDFEGM